MFVEVGNDIQSPFKCQLCLSQCHSHMKFSDAAQHRNGTPETGRKNLIARPRKALKLCSPEALKPWKSISLKPKRYLNHFNLPLISSNKVRSPA